jgi:hypothetical protein
MIAVIFVRLISIHESYHINFKRETDARPQRSNVYRMQIRLAQVYWKYRTYRGF